MSQKQSSRSATKPTGFLLWQASNLWQRSMRAALDPLELTHVQFFLLEALENLLEKGQPVNQNRLAHQAGTDKMMTSKVLRSLEARKLVVRKPNSVDTRAMLLELTDAGRALLDAAKPAVARTEEELFEVLGKKREKLQKHLGTFLGSALHEEE